MNPFIEATVAPVLRCSRWRSPRPPMAGRDARAGRRAWRQAIGAMLVTLAAGMGAPGAYALDVNEASAQQLESIRGIGPRTAEVIVTERDRGGRFESFEDLAERVRGIGQKKAQALEAAGLTVGAQGGAVAARPAQNPSAQAGVGAGAAASSATVAAPGAASAAARPVAKPDAPQAKSGPAAGSTAGSTAGAAPRSAPSPASRSAPRP